MYFIIHKLKIGGLYHFGKEKNLVKNMLLKRLLLLALILFLTACGTGVMKKEIKVEEKVTDEEFGMIAYSSVSEEEVFNEYFDDINIEITYVSLSHGEENDQGSVALSFNITNQSREDIKYRVQDIKLSTDTLDKVEVKDYGVLNMEDGEFVLEELELKADETREFMMSWLIDEGALDLEWVMFHLADTDGEEVAEVKYIFD